MTEEVSQADRAAADEYLARQKETATLPPIKIAFILDGTVVDILHTDDRLAAIFLSEPKMVDVSDLVPFTENGIAVGSTYNEETKTFSLPEEE